MDRYLFSPQKAQRGMLCGAEQRWSYKLPALWAASPQACASRIAFLAPLETGVGVSECVDRLSCAAHAEGRPGKTNGWPCFLQAKGVCACVCVCVCVSSVSECVIPRLRLSLSSTLTCHKDPDRRDRHTGKNGFHSPPPPTVVASHSPQRTGVHV